MVTILWFIVFVLMSAFVGGVFAALAGVGVGLIVAAVAWPIDLLVTWIKVRKQEEWRRKRVFEDHRSFWWWVTGAFYVAAPIFAAYAIYILCTSDHDVVQDARYRITFGATEMPAKLLPEQPIVDVKTEIRRYILVTKNPPKHFYVTLKDVETNQVYESLYVSKHCNNHADSPIGQQYNLQVTTRRQGERTWLVFNNLYTAFCG